LKIGSFAGHKISNNKQENEMLGRDYPLVGDFTYGTENITGFCGWTGLIPKIL